MIKKANISHQSPETEFGLQNQYGRQKGQEIRAIFIYVYKILDRWIHHSTILFLEPKLGFWAQIAYFRLFDPLKLIFSLSI
jgi:hypothetical protein